MCTDVKIIDCHGPVSLAGEDILRHDGVHPTDGGEGEEESAVTGSPGRSTYDVSCLPFVRPSRIFLYYVICVGFKVVIQRIGVN